LPKSFASRKDPFDLRRWSAREIILARLEQLGKTPYWLSRRAGSSEAVVYRFLGGNADTTSANLAEMFAAVGLKVVVDPQWSLPY